MLNAGLVVAVASQVETMFSVGAYHNVFYALEDAKTRIYLYLTYKTISVLFVKTTRCPNITTSATCLIMSLIVMALSGM